ncbi:unnamed protein product [Coregonus sp. 'balchen']|nr:unnamed protein product [Coregonus sp. 'balchen']
MFLFKCFKEGPEGPPRKLERDVTLLRESSLGTSHRTQHTERLSETARQDAEQAQQEFDSEVKGKYSVVEGLVVTKAEGVSVARKRAELLQQEAKELLTQTSEKLQRLRGNTHTHAHTHKPTR